MSDKVSDGETRSSCTAGDDVRPSADRRTVDGHSPRGISQRRRERASGATGALPVPHGRVEGLEAQSQRRRRVDAEDRFRIAPTVGLRRPERRRIRG